MVKKLKKKAKRPKRAKSGTKRSFSAGVKKSIKAQHSLKEENLKSKAESLVKRTKIRVIGIGGGGGSIVSELSLKMKNASFVAANTDRQALKTLSRNVFRFQFGQELTYGLGTGMNWEVAESASQAEKEKIKKLLTGYDLCIFVSSLGGGTGSGAAPVFARIARNLGTLSYGIFTLPFKFEGERKAQIARNALEKLKPNLNTISIIPNERIFQIVERNTPLRAALSLMNKNLAESLEGLIETIYSPGLINIDFADLKTVFEGRGRLTYLNSVTVPSLEKNEDLQKSVLSSPLYPYGIRGSKGVLFNIIGERQLLLSEVSHLSKTISDLASPEAKIIFGVSQKKSPLLKEGIKITLLATGCGQRVFQVEGERIKKKKRPPSAPALTIKQVKSKAKRPKGAKSSTKRSFSAGKKKSERVVQKRLIPLTPKKPSRKKPSFAKASAGKKKVQTKKTPSKKPVEVKIRRSALELRKDIQEAEKEIIEQEQQWETPSFLRKQEP